mmetsp:Transcript_20086/g.34592  ORF Transcript_20086/g.34592 Transcript_20086/m.34592 type:complete len:258 (+) Transcript_20086:58-831(+)
MADRPPAWPDGHKQPRLELQSDNLMLLASTAASQVPIPAQTSHPSKRKRSNSQSPSATALRDSTAKPIPFWNASTKLIADRTWCSSDTSFVGFRSSASTRTLRMLASNAWFSVRILQDPGATRQFTTSHGLSGLTARDDALRIVRHLDAKKLRAEREAQQRKAKKENQGHEPASTTTTTTATATTKPRIRGVRKIRLYPSTKERERLAQWFGAARWTYNEGLAAIRGKECNCSAKSLPTRTASMRVRLMRLGQSVTG